MSKESQSEKLEKKAARRAERKLPVSGSEPTEDKLEEEDSAPDPVVEENA